jgi:hypothetical protein
VAWLAVVREQDCICCSTSVRSLRDLLCLATDILPTMTSELNLTPHTRLRNTKEDVFLDSEDTETLNTGKLLPP